MVSSRIRKTIQKIEKIAHLEAERIVILEGAKKDFYKLAGYNLMENMEEIVLDWEAQGNREWICKSKYCQIHKWEILLQKMSEIMAAVKKIECSANEKYEFLWWYSSEIINFFSNEQNFDKFVYSIVYTSAFMIELEKGTPYNRIPNIILDFPKYKYVGEEKNAQMAFYMMHDSLHDMEEISVENLLHNTPLLTRMGFDPEYIQNLEVQVEENTIDKVMKQEQKTIAEDVQRVLFSNQTKENEPQEINFDGEKERKIRQILSQYINLKTLECRGPIQGKNLSKVKNLINQLHFEDNRNEILKAIQRDNQKWCESEKQEIFQMLLEEEQQEIYNKLKMYCYQEHKTILYKELIQCDLKLIDELLEEYRIEKNELLIPDYKEQIDLVYGEIALYLPYLPIEIETKKQGLK